MDGIFFYLAKEEAAIRDNPAARSTELLQKVFGAQQTPLAGESPQRLNQPLSHLFNESDIEKLTPINRGRS